MIIPRGARNITVEASSSSFDLSVAVPGRDDTRQVAAVSNDMTTFRLAGSELQYSRQSPSAAIRLTAPGPTNDVIVVKVTTAQTLPIG